MGEERVSRIDNGRTGRKIEDKNRRKIKLNELGMENK